MQAATDDLTIDPSAPLCTVSAGGSWDTVEALEDLLVHSIHLRDLYKNARRLSADIRFRRLLQLFDNHYKEQIQLVDILVDRIRALNGASKVLAGDFLQRTQFSQLLRGRAPVTHLLAELVDAHESILSTALPTGATDGQANRSWTHDFAAGQVVLANEEQIHALKEQLLHRKCTLRPDPTLD
jgi:starvation-inducible DNA-binding protein